MNNFKSSVPANVQAKIKDFADMVDFNDIVLSSAKHGSMGEQNISEIEGNYVSGWMPKQDGGFQIDQFYQNDMDSTYHFTDKQTDFANDQYKQCNDSFLMDNGLDRNLSWDDLTEEQKEEYQEYEREWFEPALLQLQIFVEGFDGNWQRGNLTEEIVTIRLSINYKDAPHYRENGAEDIKQVILSIDEFLAMPNDQIVDQFKI